MASTSAGSSSRISASWNVDRSPCSRASTVYRPVMCPRRDGARREATGAGEDRPAERQAVERGERQPEQRYRHADERHDAQEPVDRPVAAERRQRAEPDADDHADGDGRAGELERRRHELGQVGAHRAVALLRIAEVTLDDVAEVREVLHRQRLVEAVPVVERRHRLRVGDGPLAEVGRRRVTGHHVREHERDEGDAEQQEHRRDQAAADEAPHQRRRDRDER